MRVCAEEDAHGQSTSFCERGPIVVCNLRVVRVVNQDLVGIDPKATHDEGIVGHAILGHLKSPTRAPFRVPGGVVRHEGGVPKDDPVAVLHDAIGRMPFSVCRIRRGYSTSDFRVRA